MQAIVFTTTSLLELSATLALTIICPHRSLSTMIILESPCGYTPLLLPVTAQSVGKVIHCRCHRHRKKQRKQEMLLEEHVLPDHVSSNLLTADDILNDIIVFDGGDADNPPIIAPKNVSDINVCT